MSQQEAMKSAVAMKLQSEMVGLFLTLTNPNTLGWKGIFKNSNTIHKTTRITFKK